MSLLGGIAGTVLVLPLMPFWAGGTRWGFVEHILLDDGASVALSWFRGERRSRRVAVVLPGLNNSSETGFVRRLLEALDSASRQ